MRRYALLSSLILLACGDDTAPGPAASTPHMDAGSPSDASSGNGDPPSDGAAPVADGATHAPEDGSTQSVGDGGSGGDGDDTALPGWRLVWNDEFKGASGSLPDASRWTFETGGSGFGNNQLEFDTDRAQNAGLNGDGQLVLTARKEEYMGRSYTSARLKTQGKFEHGYGRYEARMRIPFGQGMWPAFWMLGADIGSAGWPSCGEIDIMENIGREPTLVHGTLHGPGYSGGNGIGASASLPQDDKFADAFHVYAIEWEANVVRWYVDGELYQTRTPADLPGSSKWVYDHSFFILLNLAVGGQWPGNPDDSTTFPQTLSVDYVRVYERAAP